MNRKYLLDIYTWPACTGVNTEPHHSWHDTPEEAVAHLDAHDKPYAYATMIRYDSGNPDPIPVDWNGNPVSGQRKRAVRYGANGNHPAVQALMKDWDRLVGTVASIQQETREGTVHIARRVLARHHPEVQGWHIRLGAAATDKALGPWPPRRRRRVQWR